MESPCMTQMSCRSWSRGAEPADQVPVHQSHTAYEQGAHTGCPWVYSRGSAKKILEWHAKCLCSCTFTVQRVHTSFIRFFQRAVTQLLVLVDLIVPPCFLKWKSFSKCTHTETHWGVSYYESRCPKPLQTQQTPIPCQIQCWFHWVQKPQLVTWTSIGDLIW